MKRGLMLAVLALVALVAASAALGSSNYDRQPIRIYNLTADGWGINISDAAYNLKNRYHGIRTDYCVGAIMVGGGGDSSWVDGNPPQRFWDKLVCGGYTLNGKFFALIYDTKGPHSWIIYRLQKVTIDALRSG